MNNKAIIGITIFSLFLIFISLYLIRSLDPGQKAKPVTASIININPDNVIVNKDFLLQTEDNKTFSYQNLQGKFSLIYFGFSYCPDICPLTMQKLSEAAKILDKNADQIQFIFVSVDPQRDDLDTLKKFTEQFDHKILGVTGSTQEIAKFAFSLKVYYSADDRSNKDNYYVDHSSFIYLLDSNAKLIAQFTHDATPQEIAKYLEQIIKTTKK